MKGFLLDTNVPSEMTRPRPQPSVCGWLDDADDDQLYLSVVSLGEILKGVTVLPESSRGVHAGSYPPHVALYNPPLRISEHHNRNRAALQILL